MVKDAGIVLRKYKRKKMFYPQKAERLSKVIVFQPENLQMILWNFLLVVKEQEKIWLNLMIKDLEKNLVKTLNTLTLKKYFLDDLKICFYIFKSQIFEKRKTKVYL